MQHVTPMAFVRRVIKRLTYLLTYIESRQVTTDDAGRQCARECVSTARPLEARRGNVGRKDLVLDRMDIFSYRDVETDCTSENSVLFGWKVITISIYRPAACVSVRPEKNCLVV